MPEMSNVRCAAYNVGASKAVDFTSADKRDRFNAKVTRSINY